MSDYIPLEIQITILKKLPVKSLIQFRSVSKQWKTLMDSSDFIVDYTFSNHAQQRHHLLMRYKKSTSEYTSFVDDDSFPQNKFSLTVPMSVEHIRDSKLIGISHGLICVFSYISRTAMAVVWNPFIRKSVSIAIPNVNGILGRHSRSVLGFGVCPKTCDLKIVKLRYIKTVTGSNWQVEVYTLSSGVWRSLTDNHPSELVLFIRHHPQVVDGMIYWLATGIRSTGDTTTNLLVSFDLSSEEFQEIHLPVKLASHDPFKLYLRNRCDSIVVLKERSMSHTYEVWKMEKNANSKSFISLFSVKMENVVLRKCMQLDFRRNGELVMMIPDNTDESTKSVSLVVYDPVLKHFHDLGVKGFVNGGTLYPFSMSRYTESLLLLDK